MRVSVVQHHGMMEVVRAFKPQPSWPPRAERPASPLP
jgi:hypothetical protein